MRIPRKKRSLWLFIYLLLLCDTVLTAGVISIEWYGKVTVNDSKRNSLRKQEKTVM